MYRLFRFLTALLALGFAFAQQQSVSRAGDAISQRIQKLRSLTDDVRGPETRKLALEIRKLPSAAEQLGLAMTLSNLSTEGDFGRETLLDVVKTIAGAVRKLPDPPGQAYDDMARLVHYEKLDFHSVAPPFQKAMARLESIDRTRQNSDFSLKDLNGKTWTLKQLRGHVVLVNFWATWCPPCRKEMPDLETLYRQFRGKGLLILAISAEEDARVRPFIKGQKYSYPILLDPGGLVNKRFVIQGIPNSLVYDRDGKLVAQSADMRTMGQFSEMLKQAGLD